jgi:hypothetical protein
MHHETSNFLIFWSLGHGKEYPKPFANWL